ncbi:glycosyltransferase [Mycobacterium sp. CPCC 205372]|uniref:4,4'-diaponeurosporenoate glycosyltransferase n=1 Tax=Mycobacterium hippophais TaxID=3016340 RepID=A0ABT4PRU1_9MYCO|nr:glycosyltransferase [Mycobacterium hippophais]MCZ8379275.1 glycosyltransferase [Mycobacterium hippophais]
MTTTPDVSVITITYRDLDGLMRTVDSVRAQRYPGRIHHIVIDGGSGEEVERYLAGQDPGFAHWQSAPDGGRYDAMNQGIAHARGELMWFMNSGDCFADPDALAAVVDAISDTGAPAREVWGFGWANRLGPDGTNMGVWGTVPFHLTDFALGRQPVPHQAAFFGSAVVSAIGGYDVNFGLGADQLFIFEAALQKEPITVPRVVCDFDTSGVGSVRPVRDNFRDLRKLWDQLGYYPLGGRRRSIAYLRGREFKARAAHATRRAGSVAAARLSRFSS